MSFQTFHTQGLVKIGDLFYVSAVEVLEPTLRNATVTDALYDFSIDRSPVSVAAGSSSSTPTANCSARSS